MLRACSTDLSFDIFGKEQNNKKCIAKRVSILHTVKDFFIDPGTLFTQAYKELTMGIPSVLTAIERHLLSQSNFKQ
jgi:hypothetical protein